jgi:predicted nucleic acid-binding protein
VPRAVHEEAASVRPEAPGAAEVRTAAWIQVRAVSDQLLVTALSLHLDVGEAEAIALAVESDADLLLMDERRGRVAALRLGRRVVGVLGALVEAKHRDLITEVRPLLDALASEAGFRISPELGARVLIAAGE